MKVVGLQQGPYALDHVLLDREGGAQPIATQSNTGAVSGERNALSAQVTYIDILKLVHSGRQIKLFHSFITFISQLSTR